MRLSRASRGDAETAEPTLRPGDLVASAEPIARKLYLYVSSDLIQNTDIFPVSFPALVCADDTRQGTVLVMSNDGHLGWMCCPWLRKLS